jgi:hypothetical protein
MMFFYINSEPFSKFSTYELRGKPTTCPAVKFILYPNTRLEILYKVIYTVKMVLTF